MSRRRGVTNSNDIISQMPDDVLVRILSFLPIKDAVVTGSLSKRWRFLWSYLTKLNFESILTSESVWSKYVNQVKSVIEKYNHPNVQDFRIRFCLTSSYDGSTAAIDEWLQFAVNKNVEFLELDLMGERYYVYSRKYDFPLRLFKACHIERSSSNATFVEMMSLKKLVLKSVYVGESVLQELLTNCPHLETIEMHEPHYLQHVRVCGPTVKLRHLKIVSRSLRSIHLSDFDLVSFTYKGNEIDLRLVNLPKLNEVDLYENLVENVFDVISSCAVSLKALSFMINNDYPPMKRVKLDSIPKLPNITKLRLVIGGNKCDCLLELAMILNACPSLQIFTVMPLYTSPVMSTSKAIEVTNPIKELKHVKIEGYYGRKCDMELVEYLIHTAVALKKIVIDPFGNDRNRYISSTAARFLKSKGVARSTTKRHLASILLHRAGLEFCVI